MGYLLGELASLERYQPRDHFINVKNPQTFDLYVRQCYRPKENIGDVYALTSLAYIMNFLISSDLRKSAFFVEPLLSDLKFCLMNASHLDADFLRIAQKFAKLCVAGSPEMQSLRKELME